MTGRQRLFRLAAALAVAVTAAVPRVMASGPALYCPVPSDPVPSDPMVDGSWTGDGGDGTQREYRAEVSDRQTQVIALGPSGSLELKTVSGDIDVIAGTERDVRVEIVRRSHGRTEGDARQGLSEVRVVVDHQGERATVTASHPNRQKQTAYWVDVSYTVTAPAGTRISASSASGDITVRSILGDIAAATTSGDILITDAVQVSAAKSASGNISVRNVTGGNQGGVTVWSGSGDILLEQITAARVDATSVSGAVVATDMICERAAITNTAGDISFAGSIERGGRYTFQSHSGDVRVGTSGPAGFELQASTFSGSLRTDPDRVLRAPTRSSRSLRGTIGDGSALLVATTFSGDVTVVTPR